jgi:hypothetical protein
MYENLMGCRVKVLLSTNQTLYGTAHTYMIDTSGYPMCLIMENGDVIMSKYIVAIVKMVQVV